MLEATTASPIKREVGNVFIPVSDVHQGRQWYRDVLGLSAQEVVAGHLSCIDLDSAGAGLLFDQKLVKGPADTGPGLRKGDYPLFMFSTDDIHASLVFLRSRGVEIVTSDGEAIQHGHWFNFRDCEGNLLMVCGPQNRGEWPGRRAGRRRGDRRAARERHTRSHGTSGAGGVSTR